MIKLSDYFTFTRNRVILFFAVPLLVVGWHLVFGGETMQQRRILSEFGTVKKVIDVPRPNHAGTKLVYGQDSESGLQVYLYNLESGKSQILFEQPEKDFSLENFRVLGWSPDDKYFAYYRLPGQNESRQIVICDGDSGATVTTVAIGAIIGGTWTSPATLVCMGNLGELYRITRREENGAWSGAERPENSTGGATYLKPGYSENTYVIGLAPYRDSGLVWVQAGALWTCDAEMLAPHKLVELTNSPIIKFAYSPKTDKFLLYRRDQRDDMVSYYDPRTGSLSDWDRVNITNYSTSAENPWFFNYARVAWLNDGNGYAYLVRDRHMRETLVIKTNLSSEPIRLPWANQVNAFAATENQLFAVASLTNEPTAIWKYDLASGSLDSVIPNLAHPYQNTIIVPPQRTVISGGAGTLSWDVYAPVHLSPTKKYSAIISSSFGSGGYAQPAANCGIYYVSFDQFLAPSLSNEQLDDFCNALLTANPNIDPNRLFIMSSSRGNLLLYQYVEADLRRFRGAVLLSPAAYPEPASFANLKILVDGALDDAAFDTNGLAQLAKFQVAALRAGSPVITAIHTAGGHGDNYQIVSTDRERAMQILKFVSEP